MSKTLAIFIAATIGGIIVGLVVFFALPYYVFWLAN